MRNTLGMWGNQQFFDLIEKLAPFLDVRDNDHNENTINFLSQLFRTNFGNNIWMHAKKRIINLIKLVHPRASKELIEVAIIGLFDRDADVGAVAVLQEVDVEDVEALQATVVDIMEPPNENFHHCNRVDWYKYEPAFWRLQWFFEAMRHKNFN